MTTLLQKTFSAMFWFFEIGGKQRDSRTDLIPANFKKPNTRPLFRVRIVSDDNRSQKRGHEGGFEMTTLLQQAFTEAAKLPDLEQNLIGSRLLAELSEETEFDRAIAASADSLARLAQVALEEHRAGLTQELKPEQL